MNLDYGQDGNEAVVYKGASADGLVKTIRKKYGSKSMVHDSNLRLLDQTNLLNILSTPLDYRNEHKTQSLSQPRALSPLQQELMSWHHQLYQLPFNKLFY